jgi:hypothetical protein
MSIALKVLSGIDALDRDATLREDGGGGNAVILSTIDEASSRVVSLLEDVSIIWRRRRLLQKLVT